MNIHLYAKVCALALGLSASMCPLAAQVSDTFEDNCGNRNAAITGVLRSFPDMEGAAVAVMAVTTDGRVLADVDASRMMLPASNMKLVSSGTALHLFGADHRFSTSLALEGQVKDGVLHGNLHIIGGGDPTLAGKDKVAAPADSLFGQWCKFLKNNGIRRIDGKVIADGSMFGGMREHPAWLWEDIGTYYGAGSSALIFMDNELRFSVSPGAAVGEALKIRRLSPYTPWLDVRYECTTGRRGTGDRLYLYTTDFSDVAVMRGTFALGKKTKTVLCANKRPELLCATEFVKYMNGHGIAGGTPEGAPDGTLHGRLTFIGETFSPELSEIVRVTNRDSNNLFAEALFRSVGLKLTGSACYDSSSVAVHRHIAAMADCRGARIVDGSGLSRKNHLSPAFLCRFLAAMYDSEAGEAFVASLPQPGCDGTLKNAFGHLPQEVRGSLHLKSGSMDGVLCYSGYYLPQDGDATIISIMLNNCTAPLSSQKALTEQILSAILTGE